PANTTPATVLEPELAEAVVVEAAGLPVAVPVDEPLVIIPDAEGLAPEAVGAVNPESTVVAELLMSRCSSTNVAVKRVAFWQVAGGVVVAPVVKFTAAHFFPAYDISIL